MDASQKHIRAERRDRSVGDLVELEARLVRRALQNDDWRAIARDEGLPVATCKAVFEAHREEQPRDDDGRSRDVREGVVAVLEAAVELELLEETVRRYEKAHSLGPASRLRLVHQQERIAEMRATLLSESGVVPADPNLPRHIRDLVQIIHVVKRILEEEGLTGAWEKLAEALPLDAIERQVAQYDLAERVDLRSSRRLHL